MISLEDHLGLLDHGKLADLVGDARLVELLNSLQAQDGAIPNRGRLVLDLIGGPSQLLENSKKRRQLFLSLSTQHEEALKKALNTADLYKLRLTEPRRRSLYRAFGLEATAGREDEEAPSSYAVKVCSPSYGLFAHQSRVLLEAEEALARSGSVMIHMPTGAGKTRTAMHLACRHLNSREKGVVLWLVSGIELCEQAADEFEEAWSKLGERPLPVLRIWSSANAVDTSSFSAFAQRDLDEAAASEAAAPFADERWPMQLGDGFVVASLESLTSLLQQWQPGETTARAKDVSLIVFDEAHRALASTYREAIETMNWGASLVGLSATPGRHHHGQDSASDRGLAELFADRKVVVHFDAYASPVDALVGHKFLSKLQRERMDVASSALSEEELVRIRARLAQAYDLDEAGLRSIGLDVTRNLQICSRVQRLVQTEGHRRVIVFAASVEAAIVLANLLQTRGVDASAVSAATRSNERKAILERFKSEEETPFVVVNFGVLTTGFDAPNTSAVVVARPTNSIVLLSQMAGRAIRGPRVKGTADALLVTVVDTAIPELADTAAQFHAFDEAWAQSAPPSQRS